MSHRLRLRYRMIRDTIRSMTTPTITHPTGRPNFTVVDTGPVTLAFSYETVIGFNVGTGWIVSENLWGPTTGKHINSLGNVLPPERLDRGAFEAALAEVTS